MGNNVILVYAKPQLGRGCISTLLHLWKSTDTIKYLLFLGTVLGALVVISYLIPTTSQGRLSPGS